MWNTSWHNLKTHQCVEKKPCWQSQTQEYCRTDAIKSGRLKAVHTTNLMESGKSVDDKIDGHEKKIDQQVETAGHAKLVSQAKWGQ